MKYSSRLIEKAVENLSRLPGVGRKSAMRIVQFLLRQDPHVGEKIGQALIDLVQQTRYCRRCHNIADGPECDICADPRREVHQLCVVKSFYDIMFIEETGLFQGRYHVLGGVIAPMEGVGPHDLHIADLIRRVQEEQVQELIFALSPTDNEALTIEYIIQQMRRTLDRLPMVTTLSRGLNYHLDLEYADEMTLSLALKSRIPYPIES